MLKVKMLARHTGPNGKMEQGHEFLLPRSYAQELIDHGLAVLMIPSMAPVNVSLRPSKTMTMEIALRKMRAKNQEVIDKPKRRSG